MSADSIGSGPRSVRASNIAKGSQRGLGVEAVGSVSSLSEDVAVDGIGVGVTVPFRMRSAQSSSCSGVLGAGVCRGSHAGVVVV
jgi:hypothetical protein